ncbi:MAG: hypothetical protein ABIH49_03050 [archaeon]
MEEKSYQGQLNELNILTGELLARDAKDDEAGIAPAAALKLRVYGFRQPVDKGPLKYSKGGIEVTYDTFRQEPFKITIEEDRWFAVPRVRRILSDLLKEFKEI